jgi:hypothetical protein
MKHLLFILIMLPNLLKAESFTYNHLVLAIEGSDNFSINKSTEQRAAGTINFDGGSISINDEHFALKPMKKENCFRTKGGMFRLVYTGSKLSYVQHYRRGTIYSYRIQGVANPVQGRNSN